MPSFEDLTIVSITGSERYTQSSIYAIQRSCEQLQGAKGLLIAPPLPDNVALPHNIEHKIIAPFGYMEYNIFVLYQLDEFIETNYCLIVQNDGWVLNGKNWRNEFWDYDYIGAPVSYYGYYDEQNHYQQKRSYDEPYPLPTDSPLRQILNGGFSLRSKKLLGLPRKLGLKYEVDIPSPMTKNASEPQYKMSWETSGHNEDNFITAKNRHLLEQAGLNIAPISLAHQFSIEDPVLHYQRGYDFFATLGGHFLSNCCLIGENTVRIAMLAQGLKNEEELKKHILSRWDVILFSKLGYDINIELIQ